jgi:competence protein ComEC
MFHTLAKKTKALCALVFDSKIIFISCTYVLSTIILIPILRNSSHHPSISLLCGCFVVGITLLAVINRLRNILKISNASRKEKNVCSKLLYLFDIFVYLFVISVICVTRLTPLISLEKQRGVEAVSFTNKYVQFQAVISSELDSKHTYNKVEVKLSEDLEVDGTTLSMEHQKILIKTKKFQKFRIGQVCNINGTLKIPENFEDFNYQEYLKNNNIYLLMEYPEIICTEAREGFVLQNILIDFKEKLIEKIQWKLNEPQSSLLMGIMFGQDRLFSEKFEKNIRIAGVSHIVAASGYNITILILASSKLLVFLPFKARFPINITLIWGFCILSGLSPSILRACIMTTIVLCGTLFGRKNTIHVTLPLATLIFVLINPRIVFDVGFQLSVMATFGLIYLQPSLASIVKKITKKETGFVNDTLLTTLSCTLTTLPITIMTFKTLSVWSILANCMILPVIESTMLLGVLAMVFGSIIFYEIINVQLMYFELVVNYIGSLNSGYWEFETVSFRIPIVVMTAIIIFCIYLYPVDNEHSNYYLKICS